MSLDNLSTSLVTDVVDVRHAITPTTGDKGDERERESRMLRLPPQTPRRSDDQKKRPADFWREVHLTRAPL
eukprot:scaffold16050_cov63-Skeletonema_dohrnii-CCMP3373.AAC.2